jgi:branched-chain amino acid transport system substrate-binding protein
MTQFRSGPRFSRLRRIGAVAIIALLLTTSIYVAYAYTKEQQKDSIKIAAILPLTGKGAHLLDLRYALEMAVGIVNRWGGINGSEIDLIIRDSQSNKTAAAQEFDDLEASEKPLMYLSTMCGISLALASKAEEAGVVLMGAGVLLQNLTEDREWVFRYSPRTGDDAATVMSIVDKLGVIRVGVLYSQDMCTKAAKSQFVTTFDVPNGTILEQPFDENADTYYDEIASLMDTDAIAIFGPTERYGTILTELREVEYAGDIIGTLSASDPSVTAMPSSEGMYLCAPYIYNKGYMYAREFSTQFEEAYGVPLSHRGAAIFDSVLMLRGLLEGGEVTRDGLRAALETAFLYSGLTGIIHNPEGSHDYGYPIYPVKVVNGELVYQW